MTKILQIVNGIPNVGDLLAPIITEKLFDLEVVPVFKELPPEHIGKPVLGGLGSFLGYYGDWRMNIWGTGYEPGYVDSATKANPGTRMDWTVYAVRGHVTRVALGLPQGIPLGDPAVLMPKIYIPRKAPQEKSRYFLHWENENAPTLLSDGLEIVTTRQDPFQVIDYISATDFVFTEALHVAILAFAYGVPWAWILNKHTRGMIKWFDWFSSIGVEGRCFTVTELDEARKWYAKNARKFNKIDSDKLLQVFPAHIAY
ncbi:exopolysaccharide glucosyl ketal-pyruvate-transferase [bacterium BMS3Bbin04]|nr:exopolysaccharide glucosyl ketal-pyruvate-transferase [bacterium BMS3Bbin04]